MTSKTSAYDKLVALVLERHDGKISNQEAHRIARNLMGYCELVIRVNRKTHQEILDKQLEYSNVSPKESSDNAELSSSQSNEK